MTTTAFVNPFVWPTSRYKRDIAPLKQYVEQAAQYLHLHTGKPLEYCLQWVKAKLAKGGRFEFKDRPMTCLVRQDNGDRIKVQTTLRHYLGEALKQRELIAPTFTTYLHPSVKRSVLSQYIETNIKKRSAAKKEMFKYRALKEHVLAAIKEIEQTGRKLGNNAVSGAHVTASTPIYNPTAHSTLTSNCRSTSGYGNANNEKFLCGNRHYFNVHIVLNNLTSIVSHVDYAKLEACLQHYGLRCPTHEEVLGVIRYSTDLYWQDARQFAKIERLVRRLTPLQCAAFTYVGDLYHLKQFNEAFVRDLFDRFGTKVTGHCDDPEGVMKSMSEEIVNHTHQVCAQEVAGIGKDYTKLKSRTDFMTVALTALHTRDTVEHYRLLIDALWVTTNVPASVAHFPSSIRRAALTSDTDSTIFTVQDWVLWHRGAMVFDDAANAAMSTAVFLAASTITHVLALMSANFGIVEEYIHHVAMKNEFKFDVFIPTQLGKHYLALMGSQEGAIFTEHELEIKGVQLKNSASPAPIRSGAKKMMEDILHTVFRGEKIRAMDYLQRVAGIEREIIRSIKAGESTYLRAGSIKDANSYSKGADESPFAKHAFFNEVFGPECGMMPDPPYDTMKVSLSTDNPSKFKTWLETTPHQEFAQRMKRWCNQRGKTHIGTLDLPVDILKNYGFPKPVIEVIDYRRIVIDLCRVFYILLECLGIYMCEDKVQRLASDFY